MKKISLLIPHKTYIGIGTNPKSMIPIVKRFFKRFTGKMRHYYILNSKLNKFNIAKITRPVKKIKNIELNYKLKLVKNALDLKKNFKKKIKFKNFPFK